VGATGDGSRSGEVDADSDLCRLAHRAAQVGEFDRDRVAGVLESDPDVRRRLVGDGGDFEVGVVAAEFELDRVGLGSSVVDYQRHRSAGPSHRPVDQEVGPVVLVLDGISSGLCDSWRRNRSGER
jgi:hypothetical protein